MRCFLHNWGWPRRRGDIDVQVCTRCGSERESKIQFHRALDTAGHGGTPEALPAPAIARSAA